jgi:tRNA modification GTPase
MSLEQLSGKLGSRVRQLRSRLTDLCSLLEIDLDFAGEGLEIIGNEEIARRIREVDSSLEEMAGSYDAAKIARDGVTVVLAGKPNAGKSSLFNAFLKESRAIVTPVPGTTRDYLEESVSIGGILFRIIDTAGIRPSVDLIEVEGIDRSWRSVKAADLILLLVDASMPVNPDDLSSFLSELDESQEMIVVFNKSDIAESIQPDVPLGPEIVRRLPSVVISALTGEGVAGLEKQMLELVASRKLDSADSVAVTSQRQLHAINRGRGSLSSALAGLEKGATNDLIAFDIRECLSALGEITGEVTTEDILNNIFAKFCIGK